MACVAEVSTGFTMMAETPEAMKLLIWSSCLATSFCASSICSSTPSSLPLASMPLRRTVRKLSSKSAIDTPIPSAMAVVPISETTPARMIFSLSFSTTGVRRARFSRRTAPPQGRAFSESQAFTPLSTPSRPSAPGLHLAARMHGGRRLIADRVGIAARVQGADCATLPSTSSASTSTRCGSRSVIQIDRVLDASRRERCQSAPGRSAQTRQRDGTCHAP